ncbi:glycosyltransferase [Lachnospiraceae bacterium ZAX-1]
MRRINILKDTTLLHLPLEYLQKTEFLFVGNANAKNTKYLELLELLEENFSNTHLLPSMEHKELLSLMNEVDCVLAPSREDATNSCIIEGLSLSKICICSDKVGAFYYLKDSVSAFIFPMTNIEKLTSIMIYIVDHIDDMKNIRDDGYAIYEKVFSLNTFEDNVKRCLIKSEY